MKSRVVGGVVGALIAIALPPIADAQSEPTPITTGDELIPPTAAPPPAAAPAVAPPSSTTAPRAVPHFTGKHLGLTFEIGLGAAQLRTTAPGGENETGFGPGVALGAGLWLTDRTSIGLRASLGRYTDDKYGYVFKDASTRQLYLGFGVQHWLRDRIWIGGGLGGGQSYVDADAEAEEDSFPLDYKGVAGEVRGGFHLAGNDRHSLTLQLGVTALRIHVSGYPVNGAPREDFLATSVAFLLGYQSL